MAELAADSIDLSWVLACDAPDRLARFYAALLDTSAQQGLSTSHWIVRGPQGMRLQFYRPSSQRPAELRGRAWSPCFQRSSPSQPLASLETWSALISERGAVLKEPARLEPFGAECWMQDPEGNLFLLLVTESVD